MREGYYSIIDGYKEPFLEPVVTKDDLSDRYKGNTSFDDIFALFTFDRSLRALTFRNLIKAEAIARTAIAYTFASAHRGQDAYLLQENYCSEQEYLEYNRSNNSYADELSGLTSILKRTRDKSDSDFISHYRNAHGSVPIWVLDNALTFGNIQHFFNLMKPNEKASVCKMIAESTGRRRALEEKEASCSGILMSMKLESLWRSLLSSAISAPMMSVYIAHMLEPVRTSGIAR